jgi:hypothetical protein
MKKYFQKKLKYFQTNADIGIRKQGCSHFLSLLFFISKNLILIFSEIALNFLSDGI